MSIINTIAKNITDFLDKKENELVGAVLFKNDTSDSKIGQIMLFNKFGICTGNTLSLKSDITAHYTDENYYINDHWALNPTTYTLTGLIGELIYSVPDNWTSKVESLYSSTGLGVLSVISPTLGSYTAGVLNITQKIESVVNKYVGIAKQTAGVINSWFTTGQYKKTNQRRVLDELEALMENRTLVSVYTPYGVYDKLAIVSVNIRQGNQTKFSSEVEVTFQKWRDVGEALKSTNEQKSSSDVVTAQKAQTSIKGLIGKVQYTQKIKNLGSNFEVA